MVVSWFASGFAVAAHLFAFVADIICESLHGVRNPLVLGERLVRLQSFIFEAHKSLTTDVIPQLPNGLEQIMEQWMLDWSLQ